MTAHDSSLQARESLEGSSRSFSDDADAAAARDDDDGDSWMAPRRHLDLAPASATAKRKVSTLGGIAVEWTTGQCYARRHPAQGMML